MDMVKAALLSEETRRKNFRSFNHFEANTVLDSSRGRARNKDFTDNRDKSRGRSKPKFKGKVIYVLTLTKCEYQDFNL